MVTTMNEFQCIRTFLDNSRTGSGTSSESTRQGAVLRPVFRLEWSTVAGPIYVCIYIYKKYTDLLYNDLI